MHTTLLLFTVVIVCEPFSVNVIVKMLVEGRLQFRCYKEGSTGEMTNTASGRRKDNKCRDMTVNRAASMGLFLEPTADYLLEKAEQSEGTHDEISDIMFVNLIGCHVHHLGDIPMCTNIRVCILAKNFLTKIDDIGCCRHLIELDVHGNQVDVYL